ncbi:MAG: fused MFS/spermidine synthase [Gemmatimonadetes bacterium]|nr:fused MFS/spermidine synthase [Gemmatimonadota bacterium]
MLQVVWLRNLKLIFGSTVPAVSTVLAAFMAGLALGSYLLGRVADRTTNRIRLYAFLELGVGLSALLLPTLFRTITPLYASAYRWQIESGEGGLTSVITFGLSLCVLLIPTTLMGGTLPVLCTHLIENRSTLGRRVGLLYGLNTAGAVLGALVAGFILLHAVGVGGTLKIAAALYLAIGVLFLWCSAAQDWSTGQSQTPTEIEHTVDGAISGERNPHHVELILIAFGLSGMAALGYEVAWTRCLLFFIGVETYAFSAMLAVFLLGLALGSFMFTRWWDRDTGLTRCLAKLEIGIGLSAMGSIVVFSLLRHVNEALFGWDTIRATWLGLVSVKFLDTALVVLVPTILMGATFPLVSKLVTSLNHTGRSIGNVYSINTIGAILGSVLAGFLLIPQVGVQLTVVGLAGLNLLIGGGLWVLSEGRPTLRHLIGGGGLVAVWVAMAWFASATPMVEWTSYFHREGNEFTVLYASEGTAASVAVLERANGVRELNLDGKSTAYSNYSDVQVHQYLGHLPLLLRSSRRPAKVLVVGFGLGSTSWSSLQHDVERVDCVELVREEQQTASYFVEQNGDVLRDPRFRWILGDGRNHLLATDQIYDVISINAVHPRMSPSLYTTDFYELVDGRLADDGFVCVWLTTHGVSKREFKMLVRSLLEVVPNASLWDVNSQHLVMVGSKRPLRIDYELWLDRHTRDSVKGHLAQVHLDHPQAILSHFLLDTSALRDYSRDVPVNSDDHGHVEFSREASSPATKAEILSELLELRQSILPLLTNLPQGVSRSSLFDESVSHFLASGQSILGRFHLSIAQDRAAAEPYLERSMILWPESDATAHLLGKCSHVAVSPRASEFQRAWARGWIHERDGHLPEAMAAYRDAVRSNPAFAAAHRSTAVLAERLGNYEEAITAISDLRKLKDSRSYARWQMAIMLQREFARRPGESVTVPIDGNELRFTPDDVRTDIFLARAYNEVGLVGRAAEILKGAALRHPDSATIAVIMGENSLDGGRIREAAQSFHAALELEPNQEQAKRQLAELVGSSRSLFRGWAANIEASP